MAIRYGSLEFPEAIAQFRAKANIDTNAYYDVMAEQHNKAFMVSGAKGAVLDDFRVALDRVVADGATLENFRKDFAAIVESHGWDYHGTLGSRSAVIYDTNIRQSYNAGRERQMANPALQALRPIRVYHHGDSKTPRPAHLKLDGLALPVTDAFWDKSAPANGYFCSCYTTLTTAEKARRDGYRLETNAPDFKADEGFDYRPGGNDVNRVYEQLREQANKFAPDIRKSAIERLDTLRAKHQAYNAYSVGLSAATVGAVQVTSEVSIPAAKMQAIADAAEGAYYWAGFVLQYPDKIASVGGAQWYIKRDGNMYLVAIVRNGELVGQREASAADLKAQGIRL